MTRIDNVLYAQARQWYNDAIRALDGTHTDPARTGLIHALFEEGAGFHTYVEWALDVPMYFLFPGLTQFTIFGFPAHYFLTMVIGWLVLIPGVVHAHDDVQCIARGASCDARNNCRWNRERHAAARHRP